MTNILGTLNQQQAQAATTTEGYLRVIAGAGSGKTKLLVSRYAYLVKACGVDPGNILCITFTNKAAGEMKKRIRDIIGAEYDTSLICTYHGFCARVLREYADRIFFPKGFQILDTHMQKEILSDIYQRRELKLDHGSFEKVLKEIAEYKAQETYVEKLCLPVSENAGVGQELESISIIDEYLLRQKQVYGMDFHDLLYFTLYLFRKNPDVCSYWQEKLNYIQVDEFQDSSKTEMKLIDVLSARHKNLMIVGDPDQNIYEWRGSKVELLVNFDMEHTPTKTIYLNQNYRSTPQILTCANTLIDHNHLRLKKDLFTQKQSGAQVVHYHVKSEPEEAETIIEQIQKLRAEKNYRFCDFAVLYRSGFLSRIIEKKFTENGIPYEIYGGVKFYQRMEIQDILAYLRLVAFDDDASFKRIINTPRRRFGKAKMQHLLGLQKEDSLLNTLTENKDDPVFKNSGVKSFGELICALRDFAVGASLSDTVREICTRTGYENYIRELGNMERFENLTEFQRIASEYEKNYGEEVSLGEFVNQLSLQAEALEDSDHDMVQLMTIHSSKGLEFPCVFLVGMSENIFPSARTIEERKNLGLEEERRLCYVAITRAREHLFLLDSEGFLQPGGQKCPSRFLFEIGEDNYLRIGVIPEDLRDGSVKSTNSVNPHPAMKSGDTVVHPVFGQGTIVDINSNNTRAQVHFPNLASDRMLSVDFLAALKNEKNESSVVQPVASSPEFLQQLQSKKCSEPQDSSRRSGGGGGEGVSPKGESPMPDQISVRNPGKENLWNRPDFPKTRWFCSGVTDLGAPSAVCELCGHQVIRYVHHMHNPDYSSLDVGCVCAGKLEGNIEQARQREQEFKNRQARKENFVKKDWPKSRNSNPYKKADNHLVVLYYDEKKRVWKYSIDGRFSVEEFQTQDKCAAAAFEKLEKLK